jgi:hypothetical protein
LLDAVEELVEPSRNQSVSHVWDRAAIGATSGWKEQKLAYKEWLGVKLAATDWKRVEQLAEARNAVAHGLGTLTRRQLRNEQAVHPALKAVGISLDDNDFIVLSDQVLLDAANACRDFIQRLDEAVQNRPGNFRKPT